MHEVFEVPAREPTQARFCLEWGQAQPLRGRVRHGMEREGFCSGANRTNQRARHKERGMEKKRVFGTGGELLVHQLVAQGVRYAFTNTGSAEAGFFNALLTVPGVQPILLLTGALARSRREVHIDEGVP